MSLFPCFRKCSNKFEKNLENFETLNLKISKIQDFKEIFHKIQEIDLLKFIILSEDQLALLQMLPKPVFDPSQGKDDKSFLYERHQTFSHYFNQSTNNIFCNNSELVTKKGEFFEILKRLTDKKKKSRIDKKLIECINDSEKTKI
jgi:hypothetical protein